MPRLAPSVIFWAAACVSLAAGRGARRYSHPRLPGAAPRAAPSLSGPAANCTEQFFVQDVDHFSWSQPPIEGTAGGGKWLQRYFLCGSYWKNGSQGVVFFYTGNEGPVEIYVQHTGLMFENAASFGALLVL